MNDSKNDVCKYNVRMEFKEYTHFSKRVCFILQGAAKVITLLENAITFANGAKCQFGFDICNIK